MNRKSNPWVALIAVYLLAVILVLTLTGCGSSAEAAEPESPRFVFELQENNTNLGESYIITDTETGVQYLYIKVYNSGGLTKLEPAPEEVGS